MRQMYERHFHSPMPDLKDASPSKRTDLEGWQVWELVVGEIKPRLEQLAKKGMPGLRPLVGLAHGDLNAANIMIDALDAVWLIDFATSVDLPLLTDLCKFEMACLFEYAILPITVENLYDLSGPDEAHWETMGIGDWLGVSQETLDELKHVEVPTLAPHHVDVDLSTSQDISLSVSTREDVAHAFLKSLQRVKKEKLLDLFS
ncbi:Hypothetical protein SCF082_LOCUS50556 [Durusdinium trenchii]|uniref:Ternary complex associated domain-containing protein n=1 Tax=Durusdinium trenchii TaxID=1381693 RepID=A0ABP0S8U1_9DINO